MPHRILYHTWSIRTVSPFAIPLFSSGVTLNAVEDQITNVLRRKTSNDNEQGTYATLAWISLSPSQRHLHIDVRLEDQPAACILLCFPIFQDASTIIKSFSFVMQRGSKACCDVVLQWLEATCGCIVSNQPFSPTPNQVAHALAVWTTLQLDSTDDNSTRPLEVTFAAPDNIAKAGLSKLSLTVPPVAVARLLQDMQETSPNTLQGELPILRALQYYIDETYNLKTESFALVRASSAAAMLGCDGRCKPVERDFLEIVLLELQSMIQSQLRIQTKEPALPDDGDNMEEATDD
jgi:hypothetical protein